MDIEIPPRLKKGDLVRVISFGLSINGVSLPQREICNSHLGQLGLRVSYGKHVADSNDFDTSSVEARIEDLHDALNDSEVKVILPSLGGMNTAQILQSINWELLKNNPKIFCGFSDTAALVNALHAKTGLVTYYGPFYGTFGQKKGYEYMLDMFERCLFSSEAYAVDQSPVWSDDAWWLDQENRSFQKNLGPLVINTGQAEGRLIGGHMTSLSMLFGTEFAPDLTDKIIMIEENSEINPRSFDRLLQCLIRQNGINRAKGMLIGRFTSAAKISDAVLVRIIKNYPELSRIPVIGNLSFGHTYPQFTFPLGGKAHIEALESEFTFRLIEH